MHFTTSLQPIVFPFFGEIFANAFTFLVSNGTLLGWVNVPIFDGNGRLRQEVVLAGLWPPVAEGISPEFRSTFAEPNRSHTAIVVEVGAFNKYLSSSSSSS